MSGSDRGAKRDGGGRDARGGTSRDRHDERGAGAQRQPRGQHGGRGEPLAPPPPPPARVRPPQLPREPVVPRLHNVLWTCRAGFEAHLFEELAWAKSAPRLVAPGLVESGPLRKDSPPPAFARVGFGVTRIATSAEEAAQAASELAASFEGPLHLQAWSSDTDEGNALAANVQGAAAAVAAALGDRAVDSFHAARERRGALLQLCVISPGLYALGLQSPSDALSPAPGGRQRMWRESSTSRASMKVDEALESMSIAPGRGEVCVDLGAAPGGWTERLLQRGARVIAVDPANMAPHLQGHGKLRHVKDSAFSFEPEEPVDWLFCDMAWRPLEVAQLLAKWGRRGWASTLVANIKLPMKDKNDILHRVRFILEQHGGWRNLRIRQLYHDRDEVTVTAVKLL